MTNADDKTPPAVPPVPPTPDAAPVASPYTPPAANAAPSAPPTYTPASPQNPYGSVPNPYAQNGQPQNGYAPGGVAPARGLSITSMILGIVGILASGFGLLISIAAVITGHMAQRRQPYARGFWLTGLITGYVGILFGLIVTAFIIFGIILAVSSGNDGYYYNS